jgi:hypothetical protein
MGVKWSLMIEAWVKTTEKGKIKARFHRTFFRREEAERASSGSLPPLVA